MSKGSYIAIDWGSTNLRAALYSNGQLVDQIHSEAGVTRLNGHTAATVFDDLIAPWLKDDVNMPVIMAGMVGSNAGWQVAPYLSCPVSLSQVHTKLMKIQHDIYSNIYIVPGLCINTEHNKNVMRGEETQLLGAYELCPSTVYVMPGTHSKWVFLADDTVNDFRTVMSGELHHLLLNHSLVGVGIGSQLENLEVYTQGLEAGFTDTSIISRLFETRAACLLNELQKSSVSDWLSGLLIANEVQQMMQGIDKQSLAKVALVGSQALLSRYALAFDMAGLSYEKINGDDALQMGIRRLINDLQH